MDVREQAEFDRLTVEALDGAKNEWEWSKARLTANATLANSTVVCRAGAASEEPLYSYTSKLTGKRIDKCVLACQELMIVPTDAGIVYGGTDH